TAQQVLSLIKSGFNFSGGSSAFWTGTGITSTTAHNDNRHVTGLGMLQNNIATLGGQTVNGTISSVSGSPFVTTFGGQAVNRNDILVMYTYLGDSDLDGKITTNDYSNIDSAFLAQQSSGVSHSGWANGDFDYDGKITTNDYALIDTSFLSQGSV